MNKMENETKTNEAVKEVTQESTPTPEPELSDEQKVLNACKTYLNMFYSKLYNFKGSRRQIINAWMNAAISPLNQSELKFGYPEEKELFDLFEEVNSAKVMLMIFGLIREGKIEVKGDLMESPKESSEVNFGDPAVEGNIIVQDMVDEGIVSLDPASGDVGNM